jgi:transcriptional regulator with XRE-family HTH domain
MDKQQKAALMKAVGKGIAARRSIAGLSQERVAEALGISREAVSRMETGVAVPSLIRLAELADVFGCGLTELLTDAPVRQIDQTLKLADLLGQLPVDKRDVILDVVTRLVRGFPSEH